MALILANCFWKSLIHLRHCGIRMCKIKACHQLPRRRRGEREWERWLTIYVAISFIDAFKKISFSVSSRTFNIPALKKFKYSEIEIYFSLSTRSFFILRIFKNRLILYQIYLLFIKSKWTVIWKLSSQLWRFKFTF